MIFSGITGGACASLIRALVGSGKEFHVDQAVLFPCPTEAEMVSIYTCLGPTESRVLSIVPCIDTNIVLDGAAIWDNFGMNFTHM